ncbi:pimeloyl-ACP methyl ester esterase BioH [Psychrobium sp. 1_MG-2023]|nr:pimeloyl-ACP methyl ester esterase BioH [Psychrobium sp. 1_MG-2023]MDP2561956.1 pimeloyl-ACP methyl ester esterase BioH [Psychrobium sp. 1_MG-2023]PKF58662.1 pimeloyl-[acyl-carrier protein] methyl ester esterase [Alteromonadales bacterium alter-6D02]
MTDQLNVEVSGQGPALVLIHGWGLNGAVWHHIVDTLALHFEVHVVDLPGFGHSNQVPVKTQLSCWVDMIAKQIDKPAIWLGWSLGGLVATQAATRYPQLVSKLVTVASSPKFVADADWHGIKPDVLNMFQSQLKTDFAVTLERFLAIQAMGSESAKQDIKNLKSILQQRPLPNESALKIGLDLLDSVDLREQLTDIKQPFLRMYGRLDSLVSHRAIKAIDQLAPQSEKVVFQKASHAPFISHHQDFIEELLTFTLNKVVDS